MGNRVLVVEDDGYLREGLLELLEKERYLVDTAQSYEMAQKQMAGQSYQLVILDIMLPDGDGVALCRQWRKRGFTMPILFLTARDEEIDIVRGLDAGADAYLTKPFGALELLSRIRALLRRVQPVRYEKKGLCIQLDKMAAYKDGRQLFLTPTEFQLLSTLLSNAGRIVTRKTLLQNIWDDAGSYIDDNTLSVHMSRLREKIGSGYITTIRGVGYRWEENE